MTSLLQILGEQNFIDKFFLPIPGSNLAHDVDWTWNFILGVTFFFFCVVVGAAAIFVLKFRRRHPNQQTSTVTHNTPLEIIWTTVPLIIVLGFFYVGAKGFFNYDTPLSNSKHIQVVCEKWQFTFNYPNGGSDSNLYLMQDEPTALDINSKDVLHAVYIPIFRTQRNAVPGRTTQIWFVPEVTSPMPLGTSTGGFDIFCTQYCGERHSTMHSLVYIYPNSDEGRAAYNQKMIELANPFKQTDPVTKKITWRAYKDVGQKIYASNCVSCHSINGAKGTGPTWQGLYKSDVHFSSPPGTPPLLATASDAAWNDYLRESILFPSKKIVEGFPNGMSDFTPTFTGSTPNEEKLRAVIEYIKSLNEATYKPEFSPEANPDLYDPKLNPLHPESIAYKEKAATQPATKP